MRTFLDPPSHAERLQRLENALKHFVQTYRLTSRKANALRERLIRQPKGVKQREERLYVGWSVAEPTDLHVAAFAQNLLSAIKEVGWLDGATPNEKDSFRKRLERTGSSIQRPIGRKRFPYLALEMTYILAIVEQLPGPGLRKKTTQLRTPTTSKNFLFDVWHGRNSTERSVIQGALAKPTKAPRIFPFSRRGSKFSGPALELLLAALNLALPHTGSEDVAGVAKRLDEFNRVTQRNLDK